MGERRNQWGDKFEPPMNADGRERIWEKLGPAVWLPRRPISPSLDLQTWLWLNSDLRPPAVPASLVTRHTSLPLDRAPQAFAEAKRSASTTLIRL